MGDSYREHIAGQAGCRADQLSRAARKWGASGGPGGGGMGTAGPVARRMASAPTRKVATEGTPPPVSGVVEATITRIGGGLDEAVAMLPPGTAVLSISVSPQDRGGWRFTVRVRFASGACAYQTGFARSAEEALRLAQVKMVTGTWRRDKYG